jgi:hypothetical protein
MFEPVELNGIKVNHVIWSETLAGYLQSCTMTSEACAAMSDIRKSRLQLYLG